MFRTVALARRRACFAIPMLALLLTYSHRRRKAVGTGPPPVGFAVFIVASAIAAMLVLRYRRFCVPGRRLYHGFDREFFYYRVWLCDRSRCIMQQPLDASAAE